MSQTKEQGPPEDQRWEVEPSAPTVPQTPRAASAQAAEHAPGPPLPPPSPQIGSQIVDPQAATMLPLTPPGERPMVIKPTTDRTSRSHRGRTLTRPVAAGPSNLTLAILWGIALLSVSAAVAFFLVTR